MVTKQLPIVAVYAGTFDPLTNGHKDIIERASRLFDRLIIGISEKSKQGELFSLNEREEMLKEALEGIVGSIEVTRFDGLLVHFVRSVGAKLIVRGLRATSDYDYEAQMALMNKRLASDIETVFLMTSENCSFISSSIVKEVARNRGDISGLVPINVARRLAQHYKV